MPFFRDLLDTLAGRRPPATPEVTLPPVPTGAELLARIDGIETDIERRQVDGIGCAAGAVTGGRST